MVMDARYAMIRMDNGKENDTKSEFGSFLLIAVWMILRNHIFFEVSDVEDVMLSSQPFVLVH